MERAVEHLGADRAGRYLRKFYPWYLDRMDAPKELQQAMQSTADVTEARAVLAGPRRPRGGGVARRYTAPLVQPGRP
jgi:hypothetical protein